MEKAEYAKREYAVPFGRYEGARPNEYPANEVLIGRERQRARMMDWLLTMGSRGAYLVTGYRGVGKSSFVQFCIKEYEDDVYGRYLQSKVGRGVLWDRLIPILAVVTFWAVPLGASLVLAGLVHRDSPWQLDSETLLRLTQALPLLLVVAHPLVSGLVLVGRILYRADWKRRVACLVGLPVVLAGACGSGPQAASLAVAMLALGYVVTHACSVYWVPGVPGERGVFSMDPRSVVFESHRRYKHHPWRIRVTAGLLALGVILIASLVFRASERCPNIFPDCFKVPKDDVGWALFFFSVASMLVACVFRGFDEYWYARYCSAARLKSAAEETWKWQLLFAVLLAGSFGGAWYWLNQVPHAGWETIVFICLPAASIGIWLRNDDIAKKPATAGAGSRDTTPKEAGTPNANASGWFYFRPLPRFLLWTRAVFALMFGLQLVRLCMRGFAELPPHFKTPFPGDWSIAHWAGWTAAFATILLYLEHDWIARSHERARRDDAYDMVRVSEDGETKPPGSEMPRMEYVHLIRELARATVFWSLFGTWLPTITVRVNLGFDNLSQTHVITSMLQGLRDEYHRIFIAAQSHIALGRRALRLALALLLTAAGTDILKRTIASSIPGWAHAALDRVVVAIPYSPPDGPDKRIPLTGYHVAILVFVLLTFRVTRRRRGGFGHHRSTYLRLNDLLTSLSSSVRVARNAVTVRSTLAQRALNLEFPTEMTQTDTPPRAPRTVEQDFLEVLRDVQRPIFGFPVVAHRISLPAPQVTFIFDELDKIGMGSDVPVEGEQVPSFTHERQRSRQLHRLFADMKNLLSTGPARFIFVGGRELHDEWLADRTSRQPLLSNVFDGEIYLPTLLVDGRGDDEPDRSNEPARERGRGSVTYGIHAYLNAQLIRANKLHDLWQQRRTWMFGTLGGLTGSAEHFFVQKPEADRLVVVKTGASPKGDTRKQVVDGERAWRLYRADLKAESTMDVEPWAEAFFDQLVLYLGFRSRGNPKRLNALIERLVRPTGRVVRDPTLRWSKFDCQHVLRFDRAHRATIQLVSVIQKRLNVVIAPRVDYQDDKIIQSALYLADYLLKFHRRAFSFANLERIDEILHVHRAPDLRKVLGEILSEWSECFLSPILEGMYDFRFRSEIAAEVRHSSRRAESEMAAFNFTLDEAQALKSEYQSRLQTLTGKGEPVAEVHAALGELHDFDEEFEDARRHYMAAIIDIDAQEAKALGSPQRGVIELMLEVKTELRRPMDWGVARLRLMLQIGMTYERSRNYERAFVQYQDARTIAWAIMRALGDDYLRNVAGAEPQGVDGRHRLETLKHLPLLYEPLFACAWAGEKAPTAIDSSLSMVEQALWTLRNRLPFVRLTETKRSSLAREASVGPFLHANFAMAMATLHLNAGNLYFFKGCQVQEVQGSTPRGSTDAGAPKAGALRVDGYLFQAQYHYACALHDIRRLIQYRLKTAKQKFVPEDWATSLRVGPLPKDLWPDFALRRSAGLLLCLADTWLAQVSLEGLLGDSQPVESDQNQSDDDFDREFGTLVDWLSPVDSGANDKNPDDESKARERKIEQGAVFGVAVEPSTGIGFRWRSLLSAVTPGPDDELPIKRLVRFVIAENESEWEKVKRYLRLVSWGARLLELAGHQEEAAREQLWAAETVECLLWSLMALAGKNEGEKFRAIAGESPPISYAFNRGHYALSKALTLLERARAGKTEPAIPTFAKRIALSLGLLAVRFERLSDFEKFSTLPLDFDVNFDKLPAKDFKRWRAALEDIVDRNAYSTLNHLATLRTLILDTALWLPDEQAVTSACAKALRSLADVRELSRLNEEYASPLHFTPFHYGTAVSLWASSAKQWAERLKLESEATRLKSEATRLEATRLKGTWLECEAKRLEGEAKRLEGEAKRLEGEAKRLAEEAKWLEAEAGQALEQSQQMYSSRQAYYDAIADLYYLDDDFNDRFIHVHHGIQMMGADLVRKLRG